jgi:hypothetical protein
MTMPGPDWSKNLIRLPGAKLFVGLFGYTWCSYCCACHGEKRVKDYPYYVERPK